MNGVVLSRFCSVLLMCYVVLNFWWFKGWQNEIILYQIWCDVTIAMSHTEKVGLGEMWDRPSPFSATLFKWNEANWPCSAVNFAWLIGEIQSPRKRTNDAVALRLAKLCTVLSLFKYFVFCRLIGVYSCNNWLNLILRWRQYRIFTLRCMIWINMLIFHSTYKIWFCFF